MTPSNGTLACVNDPSAPQALLPNEQSSAVTTEQEEDECGLQPSEADFQERKRSQSRSPSRAYNKGYRKIIRNFTPSMYVHKTELSTMTAAWLLPIVSTIVAAASGGIVAEVLPDPQHVLWTLTISYILWGTGVPLAMAVLVIYFQRLTVHKLPPREVIVSVFLPLGPLGQGGFGIMQLGKVAMQLFPITGTLGGTKTNAGDTLYVIGWLVALIMWGFGLVWLFFALASISRSKFPFNMGWWGFTFPLGVFTTSTVTFGKEMPSVFFDVLGTVSGSVISLLPLYMGSRTTLNGGKLTLGSHKILSVAVTLLWIMVASGTVKRALTGDIFFAPCLKDLEGKEKQAAEHFGEKAA
ncbi:Plasma membrane sulfite pump involved in sulfite metabolism [Xylographa soralifera]|nr:Plasma membrane sulfite pump involved in sulfite metabolism [Xylographa soralifera]